MTRFRVEYQATRTSPLTFAFEVEGEDSDVAWREWTRWRTAFAVDYYAVHVVRVA